MGGDHGERKSQGALTRGEAVLLFSEEPERGPTDAGETSSPSGGKKEDLSRLPGKGRAVLKILRGFRSKEIYSSEKKA